MFKRFQVMDLYEGDERQNSNDWVDVKKEKPDVQYGIYRIRLRNSQEVDAYFCQDRCRNLGGECLWWEKGTGNGFSDSEVTHWERK